MLPLMLQMNPFFSENMTVFKKAKPPFPALMQVWYKKCGGKKNNKNN
jgi:hypothetical protein